jgi:hypothetical protein
MASTLNTREFVTVLAFTFVAHVAFLAAALNYAA